MTRDALRVGRFSQAGGIYLVTTATAGRVPVFADLACARMVVREMRCLAIQGDLTSLAWVLMPDHLHWLIQLGNGASLSALLRSFKGRSARRIGRPIWQRAFHDRALRREDEILPAARYIIANPVRAGLVQKVGDYSHWDAAWL
jgi:putative transposase